MATVSAVFWGAFKPSFPFETEVWEPSCAGAAFLGVCSACSLVSRQATLRRECCKADCPLEMFEVHCSISPVSSGSRENYIRHTALLYPPSHLTLSHLPHLITPHHLPHLYSSHLPHPHLITPPLTFCWASPNRHITNSI